MPQVGVHDAADRSIRAMAPARSTAPSRIFGASVDPNTRAVVARIVAPNPGDLLKKQMYVDVSIESGRVSTGLLVPVSAVLRDDENLPFVYIALPDGSFARRHVTLGYRDSQNYDVTSGLASGDRIVAERRASSSSSCRANERGSGRAAARTGSIFINRIVALSLEQRILVAVPDRAADRRRYPRAGNRLPVDAYPDLSPPMVSITAQWPGHSAEEVERLITVPIEREMNGIPKENNLRSVSLYALSSIDITFDQDTDRNFARQQVFNRLADIWTCRAG